MKAILRDQKGWTKTLTIPYMMREIRLPIYRKTTNYFEAADGTAWIHKDRTKDMVVFQATQRGLSDDTCYYDEVIDGGASSNVSSPYDGSQAGATPATASEQLSTEQETK